MTLDHAETMRPDDDSAELALEALNQAALSIATELDVERVLQLIVDWARRLGDAEYAALAVGDWRSADHGDVHRFVTSGMAQDVVDSMDHWPRGLGLLGAVIHEQKSIRLADLTADPRSVGFPENHPAMTSFLGVPIKGVGETFGNLYLTNKRSGETFTARDQQLIEMLAAHAAVAVQNAKLYSQVERLAILEERSRIGMDLHDGVIQSIFAVGLTLESTRLTLPPDATESAALIDAAVDGLNDAIRDIRNFILDLRPRRFPGDVQQGLSQLVREFQANTMVPVTLSIPDDMSDLATPLARAIYLTTQEALANIARHARAHNVSVSLYCNEHRVNLLVRDDGRGFDPDTESVRIGHGLANMQARADGLGGRFKLETALGKGTSVSLDLPR